MPEDKIRVGISQGDINGIGMEVIIKTFLDPAMLEICTPVVYSSQKTASFHRKALNIEDFSFNVIREGEEPNPKKANLQSCYEEDVLIEPGSSTDLGGKYAVRSIEAACDAIEKGQVDVLVTAPIDKHNVQGEQFNFPGHTEYLQSRFGNPGALMLLVSDTLKVGVVTGHIPIREVAASISVEQVLEKVKMLNDTLIQDFGIRKPKIAVLGLNPHAGDQGTIGKEDVEVIVQALSKAKELNIMTFGPFPADGFFGNSSYTKYDASFRLKQLLLIRG
jgi:4-hydroxythreonine-4-phosphate dehydrogenase